MQKSEWVSIGGRRARFIDVHREGEAQPNSFTITLAEALSRATEGGATFSEEAGRHLLAHQSEIPESWRRFLLHFPHWVPELGEILPGVTGGRMEGRCVFLCCDWQDDQIWRIGDDSTDGAFRLTDDVRFVEVEM